MLANSNDGKIAENIGKDGSGEAFSIENIVQKRLRLLKLLEELVKEGDLKAIELYSKLLSELREDLKIKEDGNNWFGTLAEMIESD